MHERSLSMDRAEGARADKAQRQSKQCEERKTERGKRRLWKGVKSHGRLPGLVSFGDSVASAHFHQNGSRNITTRRGEEIRANARARATCLTCKPTASWSKNLAPPATRGCVHVYCQYCTLFR